MNGEFFVGAIALCMVALVVSNVVWAVTVNNILEAARPYC